MKEIKAHLGLTELTPDARYHLGYYDIDFADGNLVFQVYAHPCNREGCPCDDFRIDFETQDSKLSAFYTSSRQWLDPHYNPVHEELKQVFSIVEKTEMFQERYLHLAYLRRKKVLADQNRLNAEFHIMLPEQLMPKVSKGLGQVSIAHKGSEKAYTWDISFCGDRACYCSNLFVSLSLPNQQWSLILDAEGKWSAADESISDSFLNKVSGRFKKLKRFGDLVDVFRTERTLENYHRFVSKYQEHQTNAS